MAHRRVFKAHGSNPLKTYHRKYTDAQVLAFAQEKRRERLANPTDAEVRFYELLGVLGFSGKECEREAIFLNGDRFILCDFYIKSVAIAFEIDGGGHKLQSGYDHGRDKWLKETHGIITVRFTNAEVLKTPDKVKHLVMQLLCYNVPCETDQTLT